MSFASLKDRRSLWATLDWITPVGNVAKGRVSYYPKDLGFYCEGHVGLPFKDPSFLTHCIHPHAGIALVSGEWGVALKSKNGISTTCLLCEECAMRMPPQAAFPMKVIAFVRDYLPEVQLRSGDLGYPLTVAAPAKISFVSWDEVGPWLSEQATLTSSEAYEAFKVLQAEAQEMMGIWRPQPFAEKVRVEGVKAIDPSHVRLLPGCDNADQSMHKAISRGMLDMDYLRGVWPELRELHELSLRNHMHTKGVPARVRELQYVVLPKLAVLKAVYHEEIQGVR